MIYLLLKSQAGWGFLLVTANKKLYLQENILINLIFLWENFISALKSAWTLHVSNHQAVLVLQLVECTSDLRLLILSIGDSNLQSRKAGRSTRLYPWFLVKFRAYWSLDFPVTYISWYYILTQTCQLLVIASGPPWRTREKWLCCWFKLSSSCALRFQPSRQVHLKAD